jgi:hypothetical protein
MNRKNHSNPADFRIARRFALKPIAREAKGASIAGGIGATIV